MIDDYKTLDFKEEMSTKPFSDKVVKTSQQETKRKLDDIINDTTETFYFPGQNKTIRASSLSEAIRLLNINQ